MTVRSLSLTAMLLAGVMVVTLLAGCLGGVEQDRLRVTEKISQSHPVCGNH